MEVDDLEFELDKARDRIADLVLEDKIDAWRRGEPEAELSRANQEAIAEVHATALHLILKEWHGDMRSKRIAAILVAALSFHPMHSESWEGFPKE